MYKHLLLYFVLIYIPNLSIAQELNINKSLYEFSIGQGFTMRNFGDKSLFNSGSGFAKNGLWVDVSYTTFVTHNIGFRIMAYLTSYSFDEKKMASGLNSIIPGQKHIVSAGSWEMYGFLGGVKFSFPFLNSNVSFESNLLAGYLSIDSPEIALRTSQGLFLAAIENTSGFAGNIGGGFRLNTFKRTNITLGGEYFFANPSFPKYRQNIDVLTFKAGIALRR